jgi:hypothetical protein
MAGGRCERPWVQRLLVEVLAALLIVGTCSVTHAGQVSADDYGYSNDDGQGPVPLHDSDDHWYCFDSSVSATWREQYRQSMSYLDATTDLYATAAATCGASTDVAFLHVDFSTYALQGMTSCQSWAYWGVCDRNNVYIDPGNTLILTADCGAGADVFTINHIRVTRHELGHTAGLHHTPAVGTLCGTPFGTDAMTSDFTVKLSLGWTAYTQHHRDHIDCVCG